MSTVDNLLEERGRLGTKLATVYDAEGEELKFDIREDEEQSVKLNETIELLMAAGYFRARIKGLPAFDKVVGGMVWCISLCNVDVNVDLFYQESLSIGHKIALTEKIVKVLPGIKCPYAIQPHQIQGLDFIHIFPVIKWLVKQSIEAKAEMEMAVKRFGESKFLQNFAPFPDDLEAAERTKKLLTVQQDLKEETGVKRLFKRVGNEFDPEDEGRRVRSTLLEYGLRKSSSPPSAAQLDGDQKEKPGKNRRQPMKPSGDETDDLVAHQMIDETEDDMMLSSITPLDYSEAKLDSKLIASMIDKSEIQQLAKDFVALKDFGRDSQRQSQLEPEDESVASADDLRAEIQELTQRLSTLEEEERSNRQDLSQMKAKTRGRIGLEEAKERVEQLEETVDPNVVSELREMMKVHDESRAKETQFKDRCKREMAELEAERDRLAAMKAATMNGDGAGGNEGEEPPEQLRELTARYEKTRRKWEGGRETLGRLNREIATAQRALDSVPSQVELNQYQRRFLELYNQVASKHKETKQFYILYNTLTDVKTYMEREISLLDSICNQYHIALSSDSAKAQFVKQLEQIFDGVKQSGLRVDRRLGEERLKRETMRENLQEINDKQRLYYKTVKDFQAECKRNEELEEEWRLVVNHHQHHQE